MTSREGGAAAVLTLDALPEDTFEEATFLEPELRVSGADYYTSDGRFDTEWLSQNLEALDPAVAERVREVIEPALRTLEGGGRFDEERFLNEMAEVRKDHLIPQSLQTFEGELADTSQGQIDIARLERALGRDPEASELLSDMRALAVRANYPSGEVIRREEIEAVLARADGVEGARELLDGMPVVGSPSVDEPHLPGGDDHDALLEAVHNEEESIEPLPGRYDTDMRVAWKTMYRAVDRLDPEHQAAAKVALEEFLADTEMQIREGTFNAEQFKTDFNGMLRDNGLKHTDAYRTLDRSVKRQILDIAEGVEIPRRELTERETGRLNAVDAVVAGAIGRIQPGWKRSPERVTEVSEAAKLLFDRGRANLEAGTLDSAQFEKEFDVMMIENGLTKTDAKAGLRRAKNRLIDLNDSLGGVTTAAAVVAATEAAGEVAPATDAEKERLAVLEQFHDSAQTSVEELVGSIGSEQAISLAFVVGRAETATQGKGFARESFQDEFDRVAGQNADSLREFRDSLAINFERIQNGHLGDVEFGLRAA